MMSRNLLCIAVAGLLAGWGPGALAQAQKSVILTNGLDGQSVSIPLDHTQPAGFNAAGDFVAACKLAGGDCPNIGSGGSTAITSYPNFTLSGPTAPVAAAGASLSWNATNAQVCYGVDVTRTSSSGPSAPTAAWSIAHPLQGNYSLNSLYNAVGAGNTASYEFTLRCFSSAAALNLGGAGLHGVGAKDSKAIVTLAPPPGSTPGTDACTEFYPTGHAARSQPGFQTSLTRRDAPFDTFATFSAGGSGTPVTFQQLIAQGTSGQATLPALAPGSSEYVSIAIDVPANAPDGYGFSLLWVEQQDVGFTAMPTSMEMSLSPCAGDFRCTFPRVVGLRRVVSVGCPKESGSI